MYRLPVYKYPPPGGNDRHSRREVKNSTFQPRSTPSVETYITLHAPSSAQVISYWKLGSTSTDVVPISTLFTAHPIHHPEAGPTLISHLTPSGLGARDKSHHCRHKEAWAWTGSRARGVSTRSTQSNAGRTHPFGRNFDPIATEEGDTEPKSTATATAPGSAVSNNVPAHLREAPALNVPVNDQNGSVGHMLPWVPPPPSRATHPPTIPVGEPHENPGIHNLPTTDNSSEDDIPKANSIRDSVTSRPSLSIRSTSRISRFSRGGNVLEY